MSSQDAARNMLVKRNTDMTEDSCTLLPMPSCFHSKMHELTTSVKCPLEVLQVCVSITGKAAGAKSATKAELSG